MTQRGSYERVADWHYRSVVSGAETFSSLPAESLPPISFSRSSATLHSYLAAV